MATYKCVYLFLSKVNKVIITLKRIGGITASPITIVSNVLR